MNHAMKIFIQRVFSGKIKWPYVPGNGRTLLTWAGVLYAIAAVGAGGQSWWLAQWSTNTVNGAPFHEYNNYVIFKQSFVHLIAQEDLYRAWPSEHWDLYKYTPTFALFFGIFGVFPDLWGLIGWNLLNAGVLAAGVTALGALSQRGQALGLLFLWPELLISLQNEQSNALIAGLLMLALGGLERAKIIRPAVWIVCSVFIKLFGIMALALLPFYRKWPASLLWSLGIALLMGIFPAFILPVNYYQSMLHSYAGMLQHDHSVSYGMSVMGWLQAWLGTMASLPVPKTPVVGAGLLLLLLPVLRVWLRHIRTEGWLGSWWRDGIQVSRAFRFLWLASLMVWMVIFNHKAESPTFIIALSGILLAYANSPRTALDRVLLISCWVLSSWSPTDLFPAEWRKEWDEPLQLKVFPYILYWMRILWLMWTPEPRHREA